MEPKLRELTIDPIVKGFSVEVLFAESAGIRGFWHDVGYYNAHWTLYHDDIPGGRFCIKGQEQWVNLEPDFVYLTPPDLTIRTRRDLPAPNQLFAHFRCTKPYDVAPPKIHRVRIDQQLQSYLDQLRNEQCLNGMMMTPRGVLAAVMLCTSLLSRLDPEDLLASPLDPRIEGLVTQIRNYPEWQLTIDEMARRCSVCKTLLAKLFKDGTGYAPHQFVLQCRVKKAKELLMTTSLTIDEVSQIVGFHDRFHFSKSFKKVAGCSPGRFREENSTR